MLDHIKTGGRRAATLAGALGGIGVLAFVLAGPSSAAGEDVGLDAITGLGTKVAAYGAAIVAVVVISVGIMLGVKYLRKAVSKA